MKLQGVIILRISDFQRFFDLEEFLVKNKEFLDLLSRYGSRPFCGTEQEWDLCGVVRNWLNGDSITAGIKSDQLLINGRSVFPLGRLKGEVDKYRDKLGFKDLYGLTALYILAGVNKNGSTLQPDFGVFYNHKTGQDSQEDFILLHKDTDLTEARVESKGNFRLRTLANITAGRPVKVRAGEQEVILKEGECVTGIFSDEGCVVLLNNEATSLPHTHAILIPDKHNKRANLQLSQHGRMDIIPGVTSVWIEAGYPAYVTSDAKVVYDKKCYNLHNCIKLFQSKAQDRKLLAINKTDSGNYVLYTNKQILYQ